MSDHSDSGTVHALPPAPMFTGRDAHLDRLAAALAGGPGVVSLIGLGGAGKTAIAAEYLRRHASAFARVFVWSFYVDQDASAFLRRAYAYFAKTMPNGADDPAPGVPHGTGALYLLTKALATLEGPSLIVLDGLERVQRAGGGGGLAAGGSTASAAGVGGLAGTRRGTHGEMEDPLLKRVLTRLAMGAGRTQCLITTRFPVTDLHPWDGGRGYEAIDVGHLDPQAARALLRRRGVTGDDAAIDRLLAEFGGHALTLDHLGSYVAAFAAGDPAIALALPPAAVETTSPEEARLERVLSAYERALTPTELDLLTRVCVFRFGASTDLLYDLFAKSTNGVAGTLKGMARDRFYASLQRLVDLGLISREAGDCYTAHPAVRDHFYQLFADPAKIHGRAIDGMMAELGIAAENAWSALIEKYQQWLVGSEEQAFIAKSLSMTVIDFADEFEEWLDQARTSGLECSVFADFVSKLRQGQSPAIPTDEHDVFDSVDDEDDHQMELVREWWAIAEKYEVWLNAADSLRGGTNVEEPQSNPVEIADEFQRSLDEHGKRLTTGRAAMSKFIRAIRAGKLPPLPDVAIRGVSLSGKPGERLPADKKSLDALEEVIHHAIKAGRHREAEQVYESRMGGYQNLGRRLGDHARGARVLRSFAVCPNPGDLAWYLRGIGELEEAYELFDTARPVWAGTPLTLLGRLPEVNRIVFWEHTRRCVDILMGRFAGRLPIPYLGFGEVLIDADLCLIWGDPRQAISVGEKGLTSDRGSYGNPDAQRCRLTMAEAYRRLRELDAAQDQIDRVEEWVMQSSSVEHLIQLHLVRGRLSADRGRDDEATASFAEGLHLAPRCGYGLYHIDLMVETAAHLCRQADAAAGVDRATLAASAAEHARGALYGVLRDGERPADSTPPADLTALLTMGATHPRCQYRLGEADARAALGEALLLLGDEVKGRMELTRALELETRVRHPKTLRARGLLRI